MIVRPTSHSCKPPRLWWFTPWRSNWELGTVYYCTDCYRRWTLLLADSDEFDYLEWRSESGTRPFEKVPTEE